MKIGPQRFSTTFQILAKLPNVLDCPPDVNKHVREKYEGEANLEQDETKSGQSFVTTTWKKTKH